MKSYSQPPAPKLNMLLSEVPSFDTEQEDLTRAVRNTAGQLVSWSVGDESCDIPSTRANL